MNGAQGAHILVLGLKVHAPVAHSANCPPVSLHLLPRPSPATSSLGIQTYVGSKSLARFCCEFLNLQRLAESAFSKSVDPNEARTRHRSEERRVGKECRS